MFLVISKERDQKDVLNLFISDEGVVGEHFDCYFLGHNLFYLSNVAVTWKTYSKHRVPI